jgi:hypothetical protein
MHEARLLNPQTKTFPAYGHGRSSPNWELGAGDLGSWEKKFQLPALWIVLVLARRATALPPGP